MNALRPALPCSPPRRTLRALAKQTLPWMAALLASATMADSAELDSLAVLDSLQAGDIIEARSRAARLSVQHPGFTLGQALLADLSAIELGVDPLSLSLPRLGEFDLDEVRAEARVRWGHHLAVPPTDALPTALLQLAPSQRHVLVADMERLRLYVFENRGGMPRLVADFYAAIGRAGYDKHLEGDLRTPLGVYQVTRYIDGAELPDMYGAGAFPVNYPNGWDRANRRTGHGIWIHGVPNAEHSRPPFSSEGCLTINNAQLSLLREWVDVGTTPLISVASMEWLAVDEWQRLRDELGAEVEAWRRAWEQGTDDYLGHYDPSFRTSAHDFDSWRLNRRQFLVEDHPPSVDVSDLSLFRYGGEDDLYQATFTQRYRGPSLDSTVRKKQLWRRTDDGWRIVFEELSGAG